MGYITPKILGKFDYAPNGGIRLLGKCVLTGNLKDTEVANYKEDVSFDVSGVPWGVSYYDPTSKDLHKYRLFKGELRDDEIYGIGGSYLTGKIYYDAALKEEISQNINDGEPLLESVDYNVVFSPYDNSKIGSVDWIDANEGTFYFKPLKDGDAFKYAAIPIDEEDGDVPIFNYYVVKRYVEKCYDVGDCYANGDYYGNIRVRKYKLLRAEITDIELFEVPIVVRKTVKTSEVRITPFTLPGRIRTYYLKGENLIDFEMYRPANVSGGHIVSFSLKKEGERIVEYECSFSDYISSNQVCSLEFKNSR